MTAFKDLAQMRRSHRKFTEQEIDPEDVRLILRAWLSKAINQRSCC